LDTTDILSRLDGVKKTARGWQARCPSHDDRNASLHVSKGDDGRTLLNCFAGCSVENVTAALGITVKDLFPERENFELQKPRKPQFKKPAITTNELSKAALDYAAKRKISLATLEKWDVKEKNGNYVFNYYENGELVFVKYRPIGKLKDGQRKAFREPGGKPILWGIDKATKDKPLVICEGEFDALAISEAGIGNVVSVPSGSADMTWIELCWDWLEGFDEIVLFGDNDPPGQKMIHEVVLRLGEHRCYIAYHDYKDANEVLFHQGPEAIRIAIEKAQPCPKVGIIDVADIEPNVKIDSEGVPTGIRSLDRTLEDAKFGELTIWTGKNGEGKSTLLGQVLLEALDNGVPVFAYSGELTKERFQLWINTQAAGKANLDERANKYGDKVYTVKREVNDKIREWYRGRFFLYDNSIRGKNIENTSLLDLCEYAAKKYGCKVFVVDNLMTADYTGYGDDPWQAQSRFVGELVHFSKAFNVHVHLVAHPKKTDKKHIEKESISGSMDITNRADNVIAIERVSEENKAKLACDALLSILKNRHNGKLGDIKLFFSEAERRFFELGATPKRYGWERVNREPIPEQIKCPWDD
jgi:twinkle protein